MIAVLFGVIRLDDDRVGCGVVVDQELLVAVFGVARVDATGQRARIENERPHGAAVGQHEGRVLARQVRLHRRAGDMVPIDQVRARDVVTVGPERHESERRGNAHLDPRLEEGVERPGKVEDALGAAAEVADEFVEMDLAVAVVVLEVGAEKARDTSADAGRGHDRIEIGAGTDRGVNTHLEGVGPVAGRWVVAEVDTVGQPRRRTAVEHLPQAVGVESEREVSGEGDAAEDLGKQGAEDVDGQVELGGGHQVGHVPLHQVWVAAQEHLDEHPRGIVEHREGEVALRDRGVGRGRARGRRAAAVVAQEFLRVRQHFRRETDSLFEACQRILRRSPQQALHVGGDAEQVGDASRRALEVHTAERHLEVAADLVERARHLVDDQDVLEKLYGLVVAALARVTDRVEDGDRSTAGELRHVRHHRHLRAEDVEDGADRLQHVLDPAEHGRDRAREQFSEADVGVFDREVEVVRRERVDRALLVPHREHHADPRAVAEDVRGEIGPHLGLDRAGDGERVQRAGEARQAD